jgi:hypothetical protein
MRVPLELHEKPILQRLVLLLSGKRPAVEIEIFYFDGTKKEGDSSDQAQNQAVSSESQQPVLKVLSLSLDVVYQPWWVEVGGFYAFFKAKDQEIVTEAIDPEMDGGLRRVKVVSITSEDEIGSATGVHATFFRGSYPGSGITFGLSNNPDRPPSYFLGPSLRWLSRGRLSVATFTLGLAAIPIRTFPDVDENGPTVPENDLRLRGIVNYQHELFFAINVGFSFGPGPRQAAQ